MTDRIPLVCEVPLSGFTAKLSVPLDLKPEEAHKLKSVVDDATQDPSDAFKFACADPAILPEITE